MAPSPGSQQRAEVAPPRESTGRLQRTGYLALAASGLVLATAFGALAQVTGGSAEPGSTGGVQPRSAHGTGGGTGGPELVPGQAIPDRTTVVVDGVAVTGTMPPSSTSPTTVVSVGPDGRPTTTVITPTSANPAPGTGPGTSSRSDLPPGSSNRPTSTGTPDDPSEGPTGDPTEDPTDPIDEPTNEPSSTPSGSTSPTGSSSPSSETT